MSEGTDRFSWLRWIDRFNQLLAAVGGLATIALLVNVVIDVTRRALFNDPLGATLEVTQYAWMPILVALGLGFALQRGEQIQVNILTSPTGPRTQRVIEIASMTISLLILGMLLWFSAEMAVRSSQISESAPGVSWILLGPIRWIIFVGLIGLFLQAFALIVRASDIKSFQADDEDEVLAALEVEAPVLEVMRKDDVLLGKEAQK